MVKKGLEALAQGLRSDEELRAALDEAADPNDEIDLDGFLRVVAEQGYDVTREDLSAAEAARPAELDGASLDRVAAGATEELFGNYNFFREPIGKVRLKR